MPLGTFKFYTPPYAHQERGFKLSADKPAFAYTMEQRTGKTKLTLDVSVYNYLQQRVNLLFIIAPNGVHRDWIDEGAAEHVDPDLGVKTFFWGQFNSGTKALHNHLDELIGHSGLVMITANAESLASETTRKYLRPFLTQRKTFTAFDESSMFKTPGAKRTEKAEAAAQRSVMRRILDGTPDAENPLELYAQYRLIDPNILGFDDFYAFRHRYAEMEKFEVDTGLRDPAGFPIRRAVRKVKAYQRIDELQRKIAPYTYRVLRADCTDLPPKVYGKIWYEPSDLQTQVYEELRDNFRAEVRAGLEISGTNVLARYVRYQQVLSNFAPTDRFKLCDRCRGDGCEACQDQGVIENDEPPQILDPSHHPRLEATERQLRQGASLPTVMWACFDREIDDLMNLCRDLGRRPVRYDGHVKSDDRNANKLAFKGGDADTFIAKATSAGRGLTLPNAELLIYYNNFFALRPRLQSEDRAESGAKVRGTGVMDVMATRWNSSPTIDEIKVNALRSKQALSAMVNKDPQRVWL